MTTPTSSAPAPSPLATVPSDDAAFFAPVPTPHTRAMRTFLPVQLWRFVVINVRMLRMIAKSHGS
jgi:hypothetical protein